MGDSITAGFAMIGYPPIDLIENRDYVFSTGGADDAFTLATIIRRYNSQVHGSSLSWTTPLTKGAWLDGGVSMAKVEDCPSQVDYLVKSLKTIYAGRVDFENDWKLLTIFIGANNICGDCQNRENSKPAWFESHLRAVLTQIEAQIPRVFVNLVEIFNISGVYYAGEMSDYCKTIHDLWPHECYCVETGVKSDLDAMDKTSLAFNTISRSLAAEFAAKKNPGFTVVSQPGLSGINLVKFPSPLAYLSNLDCFHPSLCANEAFTYQIWNNMNQPMGKKSIVPDLRNLKILCPNAESLLQ